MTSIIEASDIWGLIPEEEKMENEKIKTGRRLSAILYTHWDATVLKKEVQSVALMFAYL